VIGRPPWHYGIPQKWDRPIPVTGVSIPFRTPYTQNGRIVQRLFSTFADGWPGIGLLLLRLLTATVLIYFGIASVLTSPPLTTVVLQIIGVAAGILLLIGLCTPVVGVLAAIVKAWIALSRFFSHSGDPWIVVIQAVLCVVLAMVGPGAWSIDARLFGRRRIDMPEL
jgi:putative oxidoreductase